MIEKTLTLEQIQNIAGIIDHVKAAQGKKDSPGLDVKAIYWLGRLRDWCTPIMEKIQEGQNKLIKDHTIKTHPDGSRKINTEKYSEAYKKFMSETTESIKFPEFKASQFVNETESLVSTEFWQIMTPFIEIDVEWMKEEKVKEKKKAS